MSLQNRGHKSDAVTPLSRRLPKLEKGSGHSNRRGEEEEKNERKKRNMNKCNRKHENNPPSQIKHKTETVKMTTSLFFVVPPESTDSKGHPVSTPLSFPWIIPALVVVLVTVRQPRVSRRPDVPGAVHLLLATSCVYAAYQNRSWLRRRRPSHRCTCSFLELPLDVAESHMLMSAPLNAARDPQVSRWVEGPSNSEAGDCVKMSLNCLDGEKMLILLVKVSIFIQISLWSLVFMVVSWVLGTFLGTILVFKCDFLLTKNVIWPTVIWF